MQFVGRVAVNEGAVEEWIRAYRGCSCCSGGADGGNGDESRVKEVLEGDVGMRLYGRNCWKFVEEMVEMLMRGGAVGRM